MEKVTEVFAGLSGEMRAEWERGAGDGAGLRGDGRGQHGAGPLDQVRQELRGLPVLNPRISRGENYRGLPYIMLDYPRAFGREDVFAIRTLFWWGHYFSVTLHLKGKYKDLFIPVIREGQDRLAAAGFHMGVSDDEWRHELDADNYRPIRAAGDGERVTNGQEGVTNGGERPFLKLSAKCGFDKWEEVSPLLLELFCVLLRTLEGGPPAFTDPKSAGSH